MFRHRNRSEPLSPTECSILRQEINIGFIMPRHSERFEFDVNRSDTVIRGIRSAMIGSLSARLGVFPLAGRATVDSFNNSVMCPQWPEIHNNGLKAC